MVNPKLMEMAKRLGQGITPIPVEPPKPTSSASLDERIILLNTKISTAKRTQKEAIQYWNNVTTGQSMASMPDLYQTFRQINEQLQKNTETKKKQFAGTLLAMLKEELKHSCFLSSTRIEYNTENLNARIIHNYGNKDERNTYSTKIEIPCFHIEPVLGVIKTPEGLKYLQALFDTEDEGETIMGVLKIIYGPDVRSIKVCTPLIENRKEILNRVGGLNIYSDELWINTCIRPEVLGNSFGVHYASKK